MAKLDIEEIQSGFLSTAKLNEVLQQIQTAIEQCVFRDGTAPNQMNASLDLNNFHVLNSATAILDNHLVNLAQVRSLISAAGSGMVAQRQEEFTAVPVQQAFTLTTTSYTPNANNLAVYVDGIRQFAPDDYEETSSTVFTFANPLSGGEIVVAITNEFLGSIDVTPISVSWSSLYGVPEFASRWPTYAEVTGKPATFTPASHVHATTDITSGVSFVDDKRGVFVQATQPVATRVGDLWLW